MGIYEEFKELVLECIEDSKKIVMKGLGKENSRMVDDSAIIQLAIKLADIKVVAMELED